jgi:hypothetical protein
MAFTIQMAAHGFIMALDLAPSPSIILHFQQASIFKPGNLPTKLSAFCCLTMRQH